MKYYTFKVEKVSNNEIIIEEKNYKKALKKLLEILNTDKELYPKNSKIICNKDGTCTILENVFMS